MKGSFVIGKVAGIEISIHWTFFILLAILVIPSGSGGSAYWNLAFILTIFLCVVLHELGHAMAARHFGIMTKDITLLPIGGVARLERIPEKPNQELVVAIAGPLVNVLIATLLFVSIHPVINTQTATTLSSINASNFLTSLYLVNISLVVFNLIPAFPMDGGRVFRALLAFRMDRVKATRIASFVGQSIAVLFAIVGIMANPVLLFIAWFVFIGARQEWQMVSTKSFLAGHVMEEVKMKQFVTFQGDETLADVMKVLLEGPYHNFVILDGDKLAGTLGRAEIIKALAIHDPTVSLRSIMNTSFETADENTPLEELYDQILKSSNKFIPVIRDGRVSGVIDLENMLEFIMMQQATSVRKENLMAHG